jgi:hypothetical protein
MVEDAMLDVHQLSADALLGLFKTLECPNLAEMYGEYRGKQLRSPGVISTVISTLFTNNPLLFGKWLSKSFRPVDDTNGRGYNSLMHRGHVTRQGPMRTLIAPSRFDGRPAYQLVYRAYHSICGFVHMVDEVRRLEAGRYLGIGTVGFTDAQRRVPLPFLLTGPIAPYAGDIGKERAGFDVVSDLPALCGSARPLGARRARLIGRHAPSRGPVRSNAMRHFNDKVAVLTGAGSGIGRALACALAAAGARLALSDICDESLAQTVGQLPAGTDVRTYQVDVASRDAVFAHAGAVKTDFGTTHLLFNNAGTTLIGTFENQTIDEMR